MKGKKIKKGENKSNDQPDRLVKKEIDVENLAQHFLGCGG